MSGTDNRPSIVKLSNGNYQIWKFRAEMILIKDDLWEVVEKDIPSTPDSAWLRKNNQARATIGLMIEDDQLTHIRQLDKAKDIWETLRKIHERGNLCSKLFLLKKLYKKRLEKDQLMRDHVNAMMDILDQLRAMGEEIKDNHAAALLLCSLPESYSTLITALEARPDVDLTFEFVRGKLLDEYERRCENANFIPNSKNTVLGITQRNPRFNREHRTCYFCNKNGHLKKDCHLFKTQKDKTHKAKAVANPSTSGNSRECKTPLNSTDERENYCFSAKLHRKTMKWYVDSGATSHMASDREFFTSFNEFRDPLKIYLADGNVAEAIGSGDGGLKCNISSKESINVTVKNVLFVPSLEGNLLSVKVLAEAGYTTIFKGNACEIRGINGVVAKAEMDSLLYKLNVTETDNFAKSVIHGCEQQLDCLHLWHRRLGHRDPRAIEKMQKDGLVTGMTINRCGNIITCIDCIKGKTTNQPFPKSSKNRATAPFELVHSDVCGPMRTLTHQGNRYILTIVDDYSRYSEVHLMRNKNEAEVLIKEYIERCKNKFDKMLQIIRTDGGGEFMSTDFGNYLKSRGVKRQITVPHTPQQNGVAERKNRSLIETARCMLFDANLDNSYWGEAVTTANYLQNRGLHSSCRVTPYQLWTGKVPNLSHLKVFGSEAHVYVPKDSRHKFDSTTKEGILMGYSEESKGYRVLIKGTEKIIIARTVKFVENSHSASMVEIQHTNESKEQEIWIPPDTHKDEANPPVGDTRRISTRINKGIPAAKYGYQATIDTNHEPESWEDMLELPNCIKDKWIAAANLEMEAMKNNETWDLVELPKDKIAIASRWVFKRKESKLGNEPIYRARLVAKGYLQKPGEDFDMVFAPVTRYTTVRTMLAIAAKTGMKSRHFDAKTAFLQGDLDEEIYMDQPCGYVQNGKENLVCQLKKSLYGLKQSARIWNIKINDILLKLGFQRGEADNCLYTKGMEGARIYILLYVDDILVYAVKDDDIREIRENLEKTFNIKDLGPVSSYLGINIDTTGDGDIAINQGNKINNMLFKFGMLDAKCANTPMETNFSKLDNKNDTLWSNKSQYREGIGTLLYFSSTTRPDIATATGILARRVENPRTSDMTAMKRIMRYLKGTIDMKIVFTKNTERDLLVYADADWASDTDDRKSTSGLVVLYGGSLVSWGSRKQACVSLSSTEAEFVSAALAAQEILWFKRLLNDFGYKVENPVTILEDNQGCIALTMSEKVNARTKHMDVRLQFLRDLQKDKVVTLEYCPTDEMVADMFTKPLAAPKFYDFLSKLGLKLEYQLRGGVR